MEPYKITIPQHELDDLKWRLSMARITPDPKNVGWDEGTPVQELIKLITYWRDEYDWREHEERLNGLPQYTMELEHGETIHFISGNDEETNEFYQG